MGITKEVSAWEWSHSWWMLFIFMPFAITSFLPFYLLASRLEIESGSCTESFIFSYLRLVLSA